MVKVVLTDGRGNEVAVEQLTPTGREHVLWCLATLRGKVENAESEESEAETEEPAMRHDWDECCVGL